MTPLVDCHVHVGERAHWMPEALELADQTASAETRELLADGPTGAPLSAYLAGQGVDFAVAIPSGRAAAQEYALAELATSRRILPFVQYDPRSLPDAPRRFEAALDAGARGLKVHPPNSHLPANDRSLYPLYAIAEQRRVPVTIHVGSSVFPGTKLRFCDPMLVDEVAVDFPGLQVLCAHAGRGFWTEQVFQLARIRPNVWLELSGLPARRIHAAFPELDRVRDRVLFGSDWPSSPPIARLAEAFRRLPYPPDLIDNALWRNASRLFGLALEPGGPAQGGASWSSE